MPRRDHSRLFFPASVLAALAGHATPATAADATYRVVARTGDPAPGGGVFQSFSAPLLAAQGRAAFTASISGVLGDSGIWSEGVAGMHDLQLVAREDQTLPGHPGTFFGYLDPAHFVMNRSGELSFSAPITGQQATFGPRAILRHSATGIEPVAVPGQLVSLPCGGGFCQRWLTDILASHSFNHAGQTALRAKLAGTGIGGHNDHAIFRAEPGLLQPVIREGDQPPGMVGVEFVEGDYDLPHLNDAGEIGVRSYLIDDDTGQTYWSVWRGAPGAALTPLAAETWPTPMGGQFAGDAMYFGMMGFNNAGDAMYSQRADLPGGESELGMWMTRNGAISAMCFEGMPAPDGLVYDQLVVFTGSLNGAGDGAFIGAVKGPGDFGENRVVVRTLADGSSDIIVREGDQAPGFLPGVELHLVGWFGVEMMEDQRVVFGTRLLGPGIGDHNNVALWITRDGAPPQLLIREGQAMVVGGQLRNVEHFSAQLSPGRESGRPSAVSDLGQVALHVTFTDGTESIIVASPKSDCPGDANGDGIVNWSDLNAALVNFGHVGDVIDGDLDLDGDVDWNDLNAVLAGFGAVCQP